MCRRLRGVDVAEEARRDGLRGWTLRVALHCGRFRGELGRLAVGVCGRTGWCRGGRGGCFEARIHRFRASSVSARVSQTVG